MTLENEINWDNIIYPKLFINKLDQKINELDTKIARLKLMEAHFGKGKRYELDILYLMNNYLKNTRKELESYILHKE